MKKQLFGLLLVLSYVFTVSAQKTAVGDATEANLRKNITYLASDRLEGRRTGEAGATTASGYIAGLFAGLKLKPGVVIGKKAGYLQPFPYVTGVELAKTGNEFTIEMMSMSGLRFKAVNMPSLKPVGFSPNGSVDNAGVVYAGFGIVSTEPKFDDYVYDKKDIDVKGKVVLVFDGTPENDNPRSAYARFDLRTKALIAKEKGALGMIVITREAKFEDDKLTQLKYDQTMGEAAIPMFVVSRKIAASIFGVDQTDLQAIEFFSAAKTSQGLEGRANYPDTDPKVSFKVDLVKKAASAYNVVGILPGTDPVLKNEAIVIGAHYDHLGHGGQGSLAANSTDIHHGADDNASGTAAIVELARKFAAKKNKRTLVFIAFSGEEEGLLGSKYYVNNPVFPIEKTVAMINLDMVGRLVDDKLTIGGIGTASEWKPLVENLNKTPGMLVTEEVLPSGARVGGAQSVNRNRFLLQLTEDGFGPSDHSSFYGKKVPVLFFFTGTHLDYHKPSDTADKINYDGEKKVIAYVESIVKAIDQKSAKPTYTVAKSSGTGGGRASITISLGTIPGYSDSTDGMTIDGVRDNSPAAKAGLKAGDKIIKLAGKEVRNATDYTFVLGTMKAGEEYEVEFTRGGEKMTLKVIPVKRP